MNRDEVLATLGRQPGIPKVLELIPSVWSGQDQDINNAIIGQLSSVSGLGSVTTRLHFEQDKAIATTYIDVVCQLCSDLAQFAPTTPGEVREFDKLIWRGRVISVVNEALVTHELERDGVITTSDLIAQFGRLESPHRFLPSILASNGDELMSWALGGEERWNCVVIAYNSLKSFDQRRFIQKFLIQCHKSANSENIPGWCRLGQSLSWVNDVTGCNYAIDLNTSSFNAYFNQVVAKFSGRDCLSGLLSRWNHDSFFAHQFAQTDLMIRIAFRLQPEDLASLTKTESFISGVSKHLESFSPQVKGIAISFANKISQITGEQRIFETPGEAELDQIVRVRMPSLEIAEALVLVTSSTKTEVALPVSDPVIVPHLSSQTESRTKPLFIKDLVAYLNVDEKKHDAYEMQRQALESGPTLIRQKPVSELAFYAEDLIRDIIGAGNRYNDDDFEAWRLQNLIAVVVRYPQVVKYVVQILCSNDYSLQQRMQLLSACSLAARELRGLSDESVAKSFKKTDFATKKLKPELHQWFAGEVAADATARSLQEVQSALMAPRSEQARDKLATDAIGSAGKILRVSKRLTNQRQMAKVPKNDFSQVANRQFFFPLVSLWHSVGGRPDIGHYTPIFVGHYFATLTLVLECGFPSNDYMEAIREYLEVFASVAGTTDSPVLEAVCTGLLVIFESIDTEVLVQDFGQSIREITTWFVSVYEKIIEPRVQSLVAGALLQLQSLQTSFERTLMDQMNGFY
ncbi:hypothetical protein DICA4_D18624 [Diutina catenulata]